MGEVDYTPEKTIKKGINAYLNFIKGMRHNFRDRSMKACMKNIDRYVKQILLDGDTPIENRAVKLKFRMREHLNNINKPHNGEPNKEQKSRNLNMLIRKLAPLIRLSKLESRKIAYRDRGKAGMQFHLSGYDDNTMDFNRSCKYYPPTILGEDKPDTCLCGMDMTFCNKNCGYATNNPLASKAYKVDTITYGGLEGSLVWNKGGKGTKTKSIAPAHIKKWNEDNCVNNL